MSLLIIGGCHVSGYNVPPKTSFAELLGNHLRTRSKRLSPLPLKRHSLIHDALREQHPDTVVLQLGNYEFHGSLKRLFSRQKISPKPAPGMEHGAANTGHRFCFREESPFRKTMRFAIMPLFVLMLIFRNSGFLNSIRRYIGENPRSRFVILSPIPCLTFSDNVTRKMAGKYFRMKFGGMPNVTFIDLYEQPGLFPQDCYADPSHLNETGHKKLFEHIAGKL